MEFFDWKIWTVTWPLWSNGAFWLWKIPKVTWPQDFTHKKSVESPAVSSREIYLHDDVTFSHFSAISDACVYVWYSCISQQGEVTVGDKNLFQRQKKPTSCLLGGWICLPISNPRAMATFLHWQLQTSIIKLDLDDCNSGMQGQNIFFC